MLVVESNHQNKNKKDKVYEMHENEWFYDKRNELYARNVTNFNKISEDKTQMKSTIEQMDSSLEEIL